MTEPFTENEAPMDEQTMAELREIAAFCRARDLILVSDEIHHDLVLPGSPRHTVTALAAPEIADRLVTLTAATKSFNLAGAHLGNAIIPDAGLRARYAARMGALGISPGLFGPPMVAAAYSPEGAAWVDRQIAAMLRSDTFAEITDLEGGERWDQIGRLLADAATGVERAGADFLVLCTTTFHKVADEVEAAITTKVRARSRPCSATTSPISCDTACSSDVSATRAISVAAAPISTTEMSSPITSTPTCSRAAPATARTLSSDIDTSAMMIWIIACQKPFLGARSASDKASSALLCSRISRYIFQQTHNNRIPPASVRPTMASSCTAIRANRMRRTTAPPMPQKMTRRRIDGSTPAAAMPTMSMGSRFQLAHSWSGIGGAPQ